MPLRQKPLELGATAVVHSVTEFIGGHSDLLLGAVVSAGPASSEVLERRRGVDGRIAGPLGAVLSFEVEGSAEEAEAVCDRTRLIVHATSLGGVETLIERRAGYPSELTAGTPATLLRLSVGIEDVEDLWDDLERALER